MREVERLLDVTGMIPTGVGDVAETIAVINALRKPEFREELATSPQVEYRDPPPGAPDYIKPFPVYPLNEAQVRTAAAAVPFLSFGGIKAVNEFRPADLPRSNIDEIAEIPRNNLSRRVGTTGKYRGAPRHVDTPHQLARMRRGLQRLLEEGSLGRYWYDNSSRSASDLTGNRPGYKDRYTGTIAITSQDAAVPANQVFGVRGYNQGAVGDPPSAGRYPNKTSEDIAALWNDEPVAMGNKRRPFHEALNVTPGQDVGRPTNDLWMARAFDYTDEAGKPWTAGLGEAQHRFMDDEINHLVDVANQRKIGGHDDWTPERVQAAVWVAKKAEVEGTTVQAAARDFSHQLDDLTARITVESEPSVGLNHLAGARDNPEAAAALHQLQRDALTDDQGRDLIALQAGALTRPTVEGPGYYRGGSAQADAVQVLAGPATGSAAMDPSSQRLVEGVAAAHGLVRGQDSVGYNYLRDAKRASERSGASVNLGAPISRNEMLSFGGRLDDEFGGAIIPTHTAEGVNALVIDDVPADWQKTMNAMVRDEFGEKPRLGQATAGLVGDDSYKPSAYLERIDAAGDATGRIDVGLQKLAPELEQVDDALLDTFPDAGQRSEMLQLVRRTLAGEGLEGIRRLVQQGVLPVAVLGTVGALLRDGAHGSTSGDAPSS